MDELEFVVFLSSFVLSRWTYVFFFFFSSRRRHTRCGRDWSSDVCSSDLLNWLSHASPCDFGFVTERWTAPRVALLIERRFGVRMNHRYLNDWLRHRGGITPQVPERRPRERDQ